MEVSTTWKLPGAFCADTSGADAAIPSAAIALPNKVDVQFNVASRRIKHAQFCVRAWRSSRQNTCQTGTNLHPAGVDERLECSQIAIMSKGKPVTTVKVTRKVIVRRGTGVVWPARDQVVRRRARKKTVLDAISSTSKALDPALKRLADK